MAQPSAVVDVAIAHPGQPYSADLFGHFIEHFHRQVYGGLFEPGSPLSDERGFRRDVIDALRELKPSVVRWPGGCFVSSYHWLDGVGPQRRPHYDKAWRVTDPNTFGTAEFVDWCQEIGAEPYICTNAGTGTAEEMSDWVEYCNLPADAGRWAGLRAEHGRRDPFDVGYWSIGNENYGSWEMGAKTAEEWAVLVRESAKMIRRVDPTAHLLTAARADLEWTLPLLAAAGPYLDLVSIHGYWDELWQEDDPVDYRTAVARSLQPQHDIQRTADIIGAAGHAGEIGIAFDEWNLRSWHHPDGNEPAAIAARDRNDDNATYTMADAIFSAAFLNSCLRRSDVVKMANIAPTVNTRGPLFTHAGGVVRRSTFHVLSMYANLLGSRVLHSYATSPELSGADVPVIDQLATIDADGRRIVLVLINRSGDEPVDCTVRIGGRSLQGSHPATVLDAPSVDSYNDVEHPDVITPQSTKINFADGTSTLPPHSITVCQVDLPLVGDAVTVDGVQSPGDWQLTPLGWQPTA